MADPRDDFGFGSRSPAPQADCTVDRFTCARASDPFADEQPFALATWLPAAYLLTLPVGISLHDDVASYALGASRDGAGPNFGGATGLENRWTIDGAPSDSVRTGGADTRIPLAFLDGIVVTAGGFAARDRTSTGGAIDARLKRGTDSHRVDVRAWAGLSAKTHRLPVTAQTYQLRTLATDPGPEVGASVVATGPLGSLWGGRAWYTAGIAPDLAQSKSTFSASSLVDADQDGVPDGLPGVVATAPISTVTASPLAWSVPTMLRLGFDRAAHHVELTLIGSIGGSSRFVANSTLPAAGVTALNGVGDGIATWRGQWSSTRARVQAAWHRSIRRESARDPKAANIPQLLSAFVPGELVDDPAVARACGDGTADDAYPLLANCPIPTGWFTSGGAGLLSEATGDRPTVTADIAHRVGDNVVRAGVTGEDARLITTSRFTGGEQQLSLFQGQLSQRRFVDPTGTCSSDPTQPCSYAAASSQRYRTRYVAAYLEDTWHAAPDIAVNGGVRWELMWVGTTMKFSNQLSPRLGWTWDPLGSGKSRVWTSMGRAYALLPAGLGAAILRSDATADDIAFGSARLRTVDPGAPLPVAPDVQPIAQDELTVGAQLSIARLFTVTGWLQGRWLRRGLESVPSEFDTVGSAGTGGQRWIDLPPHSLDGSAAHPGGARVIDNPGRVGGVPALRDTAAGALEIATALRANLVIRVGYMYSHTTGSWTGAYDPRVGAVLYNSSDFDANASNQLGVLPSDAGHRLYVEGVRRGRIGEVNLTAAARLTLTSGRPRDALGDGDDGLVYLIKRGAAGRGPLISQANVRLAANWRGFELALDVFNVFDRSDASAVDALYTSDAVRPIHGGSTEDLVFLKTIAERPATRRLAYRAGTAFQSPIAAMLQLHREF